MLSLGALPRNLNVVSYWFLDEASGTRADQRGTNNLTDNNTVTQGTGHEGGSHKCAVFTAANSEFLSIASPAGLDGGSITAFTVTFWMYVAGLPGGTNTLVSKGTEGVKVSYRIDIQATGKIACMIGDGGGAGPSFTSDSGISAGAWHHIAVVYSQPNAYIYTDGVLNGSYSSMPTHLQSTNIPFCLGAQTSILYFEGSMSEVAFWNISLSATEVKQVYTETCGGAAMLLML